MLSKYLTNIYKCSISISNLISKYFANDLKLIEYFIIGDSILTAACPC